MTDIIRQIYLTLEELLEIYHKSPEIFRKFPMINASIQENGNQLTTILLKEFDNGNYWLIIERHPIYYLLPKSNLKIDDSEYQNIQVLFTLKNYQNQNSIHFNVKKPAIVSRTGDNNSWKLDEKGILEFNPISSVFSQETELHLTEKYQSLQIQSEHLKSQLKELYVQKQVCQAKLDYSEQENQQFLSRLDDSQQENQQLLSKLSLSEQEHQRLLSRLNQLEKEHQHLLFKLSLSEQECQQFSSRLKQSEQERQQLLTNLEKLANTYQESLAQLANWGNFLNHTQQILEEREFLQSKIKEFNQVFISFKSRVDTINSPVNSSNSSEPTSESILNSSNILEMYNQNPYYFSEKSIEVTETKDSFENRRAGHSKPPILTQSQKNRGIAWIIPFDNDHNYLVPVANLKINEPNCKLLEALFDCQNCNPESSNKFSLIKVAKVICIQGNWQLIEKGELRFE